MRKISTLIAIAILSLSCKNAEVEQNKTVVLKGTIANYDQDTLYMSNVTSKFMRFEEEIRKLPLAEKSNFEFRFDLEEPAYFQIGRTFLYLSPGDSLVANLDSRDRSYAIFSGKGSEANNYLTNLPYPKGGSFWGDRDISSKIKTYQDAGEAFKLSVKTRMDKLEGLTTVSEDFKRLEVARTKFDYVNSLGSLFYLYYGKVRKGDMTQEEMNAKIEEANAYLIPHKMAYLDDFNQTDYLQLEVFQSLLYTLKDDSFRKDHQLPELDPQLQEYLITNNIVNTLKFNGYSNQAGEQLKEGVERVTNPDYKAILQNLEDEYKTILKGNPASDLTFTQLEGNTVKLSNYKGKVIVLDLWATWCGPCMKEKPFFEALEKTYHGNDNVELISLSIDKEKVWRNYFDDNEIVGNQLQINRSQLSDYKVAGIPRFFVIDKNFNIVDVFAPMPSTGELEKLINKYL